jgi:transcription antitermination factor NusG
MPWHIARVFGHEHQAAFYLRRHGLRCFYPVEHHYYIDKRTRENRFRIVPRFKGYVFVELLSPVERARATQARHVAGFLGSWTGDGYRLATVADHYVTDLMDARPREYNKPGCAKFKPGQKVKLALNAITEIIGIYKGEVDTSGNCVISVNTLGKACDVPVKLERLEAAE